jgi:hypothetical protein
LLIKNNKRPLNESETHYELKQIAKYILKSRGYTIIGEEICVNSSNYLFDYPQFNKKTLYKDMIDVIGLQNKGTFYFGSHWKSDKIYFQEPIWKAIGFESKASLGDFKNGFCCTPEKTYIIAPLGVIPKELIPRNIGLFEVDLDNYEISTSETKSFDFKGIYETIKPKIRIDKYFVEDTKPIENPYYQHWCKDVLRYIAYVKTNQDLYKNNQIIISDKKWRGNKE